MFSLTSSNITQTQGHDPSARLSRRTTPSAIIVGAAAVALLASANTFANAAENSSRMAREHHACTVAMGLHQPGDLYDTCIRSLNKSLSELDQARLVSTDRSKCAKERLKPGTPAFAVCVADPNQSPADAGRKGITAIYWSNLKHLQIGDTMSRMILICSFAALLGSCGAVSADQDDWAQARLACADVGIAPGSGAFGQCVFDLYYSLWDEQNERDD